MKYYYLFPDGFFNGFSDFEKFDIHYEGDFFFNVDGICQVCSGSLSNLESLALFFGYELHPDYLYSSDDIDLLNYNRVYDLAF